MGLTLVSQKHITGWFAARHWINTVEFWVTTTNNESVIVQHYQECSLACNIPGYDVTVRGDYCEYKKTDIKTVFSPISPSAANKVLKEYKKRAKADSSRWDASAASSAGSEILSIGLF